jgi:hypothetical protein
MITKRDQKAVIEDDEEDVSIAPEPASFVRTQVF